MSVVYRTSDIIDVKIGKMTISISPLNYKVKSDIQSMLINGKALDAAVLALRHGIKKISGLKLADGSDYKVNLQNDVLDESHIDDLLNIPEQSQLTIIALELVNGIPQKEFVDPQTGGTLEGVKIVKKASSRKK